MEAANSLECSFLEAVQLKYVRVASSQPGAGGDLWHIRIREDGLFSGDAAKAKAGMSLGSEALA